MLAALLVVVAAACDKLPARPDLATFDKLSESEQCEAAAPRGTRCIDDLLIADIKALDLDIDTKTQLVKELRTRPTAPADQRTVHDVQCHGDPAYAKAIVACWTIEPCKEFVDCVEREKAKAPRRKHAEPAPPLDLDQQP